MLANRMWILTTQHNVNIVYVPVRSRTTLLLVVKMYISRLRSCTFQSNTPANCETISLLITFRHVLDQPSRIS